MKIIALLTLLIVITITLKPSYEAYEDGSIRIQIGTCSLTTNSADGDEDTRLHCN